MYVSLYVVVNTFIGGRQPQNKLMRLRTFKKIALRDGVVFIEVDEDSHAQYDPSCLNTVQT